MAETSVLNLRINSKQALAALNKFNSKLNRLSKTVSLKVSTPLIALEGIALKTFSEMEKGLTDITNLIDKGEGFKKYEDDLKGVQELAIEMGFAIDDVNKSLFDNVSALGQGDIALESYAEAQKLAIGGNAQLAETVDGITSIINAYGKETAVASDISNAFFTAQQKGKTTVSELANNIGKVAPIAKSAGIGFKELLATMSTLTLGGLSTDEATTSLRATISSLVKPTKEAEKVLRSLGVPVGALELQEKGLGFALSQLSEAQKDNADILAQAIPNIRALTGVTSFSADKLEILRNTQEKMNRDIKDGTGLNEAYTDSLDDFSIIAKQTYGATKTLVNEIGVLLVDGLDLKQLFKDLGETAKDLKTYIKEMSPEMKTTALAITGIATVVPPAIVGVTGFAASIGVMASALKIALPLLTAAAIPLASMTAATMAGVGIGHVAFKQINAEELKSIEIRQEKLKLANEETDLINKQTKEILDRKKAEEAEFDLFMKNTMAEIKLENKLWETQKARKKDISSGYGKELGLAGLSDPNKLIRDLINFDLGISGLDDDSGDSKTNKGGQEMFSNAVLKGTQKALELENTKQGNKTEENQLKELKKQSRSLSDISSNQSEEIIVDF